MNDNFNELSKKLTFDKIDKKTKKNIGNVKNEIFIKEVTLSCLPFNSYNIIHDSYKKIKGNVSDIFKNGNIKTIIDANGNTWKRYIHINPKHKNKLILNKKYFLCKNAEKAIQEQDGYFRVFRTGELIGHLI